MSTEVSCGNCSGRLLVETQGVIVVCPHCGIHLSIPELGPATLPDATTDHPSNSSAPTEAESPQPFSANVEQPLTPNHSVPEASDASRAETIVISGTPRLIPKSPQIAESFSSIFHSPEDEQPATVMLDNVGWLSSPNLSLMDTPDPKLERFEETLATEQIPANETVPETSAVPVLESPSLEGEIAKPESTIDREDRENVSIGDQPWTAAETVPESTAERSGFPDFGLDQSRIEATSTGLDSFGETISIEETHSGPSSREVVTSSEVGRPVDDSNSRLTMLLMVLGSYASLATIILLYQFLFGRAHQLESLPDLKTVQQMGGRAAVPKPENELPPGHELRFGQTRRFGNLRVTPIRVTRGPILFEHQSGDPSEERSPSEPVLKLWLKFENVSANEAITPLDTTLMFFRRVLDHRVASYNMIFREADRKKKDPQLWYPFRGMAVDTEWLIVGQHTNEALESRKSFETFIPSEEDLDGLTGDLVWRVHFRKGYGPRTGNGVTTLIDIRFKSDDIKPDAT